METRTLGALNVFEELLTERSRSPLVARRVFDSILAGGRVQEGAVTPEDFGLPRSPAGAIDGGAKDLRLQDARDLAQKMLDTGLARECLEQWRATARAKSPSPVR